MAERISYGPSFAPGFSKRSLAALGISAGGSDAAKAPQLHPSRPRRWRKEFHTARASRQDSARDPSLRSGFRLAAPTPPKRLNFTHPARADGRKNFVRPELRARIQQEIPRCARDFGWRLRRRQSASTSPIPPAPMAERISYGPSFAPGFSKRSLAALGISAGGSDAAKAPQLHPSRPHR